MLPDNLSVSVVVVILRNKDVVFLQQRREVLADPGPHVQEGNHDHDDPDQAERGLRPHKQLLVHVKVPMYTSSKDFSRTRVDFFFCGFILLFFFGVKKKPKS